MLDAAALARERLAEGVAVQQLLADDAAALGTIAAMARAVRDALAGGGKVIVFGNGGSAADALHIAGELAGRFAFDRRPLPAIALGSDVATTTAIANDYGFEEIFSRPVRALARPGDVILALSTSGRSPNVIAGCRAAAEAGAQTLGLTGRDGGELAAAVDRCLRVPSDRTPRIQEVHIAVAHVICEIVERDLCS